MGVMRFCANLRSVGMVPLLVLSLTLSGAGSVLCTGPDGRAVRESISPLLPCGLAECAGSPTGSGAVAAASEGCVDTPVPALVMSRVEQVSSDLGAYPLPSVWFASCIEDVTAASSLAWSPSRPDPPKLRAICALRTVILLV